MSPGAIGVIQLSADSPAELESALGRLDIAPPVAGQLAFRNLCNIDRGIVARWTANSVCLMPHAGPAVLHGLARALSDAGLPQAVPDPARDYPEGRTLIEARVLAALARAASPLAIDLLLDQPARWTDLDAPTDPVRDRFLNRLIDPPLVVAIGPPNIGKSSLINALAGRQVSVVADQPGTTRDHVGVLIDAAGLVIRYADTPGLRRADDPIESEAAALAAQLAASADLVLCCGDASAPPPPPPPGRDILTIATRADLGVPQWPHDGAASALTGAGLEQLTSTIRDRLIPPAALADPAPWRFW
jgi:hypothetical protein